MCNQKAGCSVAKRKVSPLRKTYIARLVIRCLVLVASILLWWYRPEVFGIVDGWEFFKKISILHVLWLIWVIDMVWQMVPAKLNISLGSQKWMAFRFRPSQKETDREGLRKYTAVTAKRAGFVFLLWSCLIAAIGVLFWKGIIDKRILVLISVFFYVCDLICVVIWCPFRLMLGNRCCTTCRIFNWDHIMMFSPLIFMDGFFARSLVVMAVAVFVLWEAAIIVHPERFWEKTNVSLSCASCTDKLCTQYCGRRKH